jgi:hypothetical protein
MGMLFESSRRLPAQQPAAANTAKENPTHPPERSLWNWVTHDAAGFFTLWLVIVGGGQIGLFYWQLRLIKIAADDAKRAGMAAERAAKATEDAVQLSRQTAERQLRAYLLVTKAIIGTVSTGNCIINISIRNFGQTPARDVTIWVDMLFGNDFDPVEFIGTQESYCRQIHLGSGREEAFFERHSTAIHVWGEVRYLDSFDVKRRTKFRLIQRGGPEFRDKPMAFAQEGNEIT